MLIGGKSANFGSSRLQTSEVLLSSCLDVERCYLFPSQPGFLFFFFFLQDGPVMDLQSGCLQESVEH